MEIVELDLSDSNEEERMTELKELCFISTFNGTSEVKKLNSGDFFMNINDGRIFKVLFRLESGYEGIETVRVKIGEKFMHIEALRILPKFESKRYSDIVTLVGSQEVGSFKAGTLLWS